MTGPDVLRNGEGVSIERVRASHGVASRRRRIEDAQWRCNIVSKPAIRTVTVAPAAAERGGDRMLDVGPRPERGRRACWPLVDRLGAAGADRAAARAHEQVRRAVGAGAPPPGLRRLAEGLTAAGAGELPPAPRAPGGRARLAGRGGPRQPAAVLDDVEPHEVAAAVAALVDDGRRVIVTASDAEALDAVRARAAGRSSSTGWSMRCPRSPRRTCTASVACSPRRRPRRRARAGQQLPDLGAFPAVAEVAQLCATAVRRELARHRADRRRARRAGRRASRRGHGRSRSACSAR